MGSLRQFFKLKYLSVQESVLLGHSTSDCPHLESVLPPGLKRLRLQVPELEVARNLHAVLEKLVKDSLRITRETDKVELQVNTKLVHVTFINLIYHSNRELLERTLPDLNEKARQGGLGLRVVLDGRK